MNAGLDLQRVVQLPPGEDPNEWLAMHGALASGLLDFFSPSPTATSQTNPVVDFYNRINLIYGTVSDFCSADSCKTMSGGTQCVPCVFF